MFARIGNGVFHYKQSFINTHNKNSSIFQQMEEFFIAYTQSISPFGYGRTFLIAIPNPFSPFGYGRVFPIAYTQTFFSFWVWAGISYCLYPIHFHLLGMGGHFLLLMPNPFSPFEYGRAFLIAYTQSIPKKCPVKVFHRALKHFLLFSYRNFLPDIRQSV